MVCREEAPAGVLEGEVGFQLPWSIRTDVFLPLSSAGRGSGRPYFVVSMGNSVETGSSGHAGALQVSRAL